MINDVAPIKKAILKAKKGADMCANYTDNAFKLIDALAFARGIPETNLEDVEVEEGLNLCEAITNYISYGEGDINQIAETIEKMCGIGE